MDFLEGDANIPPREAHWLGRRGELEERRGKQRSLAGESNTSTKESVLLSNSQLPVVGEVVGVAYLATSSAIELSDELR
jgi:hypothetical protein